jgi:Domain of unknown function (DUF1918)
VVGDGPIASVFTLDGRRIWNATIASPPVLRLGVVKIGTGSSCTNPRLGRQRDDRFGQILVLWRMAAADYRGATNESGVSMAFKVGKRVVAESESIDRRPRAGVVEEVLRGDPAPRYRIRWDDGHESIYTPASGALRAEQRPKKPQRAAARKR